MKSYTEQRDVYSIDTKNSASANLTYGDQIMNDFHKRLLAKADWPFLHQTRSIYTLAPESPFTADAGTNICTVTASVKTFTGTPVKFTSTDTLPAGLSENTLYFLIYQSTTTFKVATSLANALAGTAIDITDTGTGTHAMQVQTPYQPLPYDVDLIESVSVIVSSTTYNPDPAPSQTFWDELHYSVQNSDFPQFWWVKEGEFALWPTPVTSGSLINLNARIRVPDLNIADYSTGTIDIITNGSVKVTGAGTSWTAPMEGRYLRVTHSNTAASSGDGEWYRIAAVESSTVLYLARPYGGRSLTTGAGGAYTIGQMGLLPEAFQDLPEQFAAYRYWMKESDEARAEGFKSLVKEGTDQLFTSYGFNDLSMVIDDGDDNDVLLNPNLTIRY